jgi:hypothetical protein
MFVRVRFLVSFCGTVLVGNTICFTSMNLWSRNDGAKGIEREGDRRKIKKKQLSLPIEINGKSTGLTRDEFTHV